MKIRYEIKIWQVFLWFVLTHVVFWTPYFFTGSTLIPGDWTSFWDGFYSKDTGQMLKYEKILHALSHNKETALFISIGLFSFLNTLLFIFVKKIFDIFNEQYSTLISLLLLTTPSSIYFLSGMYKDQIAYLAFAMLLFIVSRFFAHRALNSWYVVLLYFFSFLLLLYTRPVYLDFVNLILLLSVFFFILWFSLAKEKKQFVGIVKSFIVVVIVHFITINTVILHKSVESVVLHEGVEYKEKGDSTPIIADKVAFLEEFDRLFRIIQHRKRSNLLSDLDAELNYGDLHELTEESLVKISLTHIKSTFFAPYINGIWNAQASVFLKLVYTIETLANYVLISAFIAFVFLHPSRETLHISIIVFSCSLLMNLLDANFGTYLRHSFIFFKLMTGVGLLFILIKFNPSIDLRVRVLNKVVK